LTVKWRIKLDIVCNVSCIHHNQKVLSNSDHLNKDPNEDNHCYA